MLTTRVSYNSFRLLLLAFIPLCAFVGVARADIEQSFNFSGVLATPINTHTSVTGQFTIDFTAKSITAFDFTTPAGDIDSPGFPNVTEFQGEIPDAPFTALEFGSNTLTVALLFESPLSAFSASSFYTGAVTISNGEAFSQLSCTDPNACSGAPATTFSSGSVTPVVSAVPEPRSALLLIGILLFTICAIRWKAKPLGSH